MDIPREFDHKPKYPVRGHELDQLRQSRGLSLEQLAKKAKIHVKTLKRILSGNEARISTIDLLAKALGVSCNHLRADIQRPEEQERTAFTLDLTLHGTLESLQQLQQAVNLSPLLKGALEQTGIKVTNLSSRLHLINKSGEFTRSIAVLYGVTANGTPFWLFAAVLPSRYEHFITSYRDGTLDIHAFSPYGEIIVIGEGKDPPDSVVDKVAEMYQTTSQELLKSLTPQPPPKEHSSDVSR